MGVFTNEYRKQDKDDGGQHFEKDYSVCDSAVPRQSFPAVVQHGRLADCRKLSGKQRAGSRQLIGKSDFFDGRFHQRYRDGCRCCHREVLWSEKQRQSAEGNSHDRGLRNRGRPCIDCDRHVSGTEDPGADGNAVRCVSAVG